jgi:hypothetical protein
VQDFKTMILVKTMKKRKQQCTYIYRFFNQSNDRSHTVDILVFKQLNLYK